ncbi:MAG: CAP domain-containing protein [Epsilonproteobacteria bacterium]|nr:CAP domain-containing protein [Campylobacterota bacterium]
MLRIIISYALFILIVGCGDAIIKDSRAGIEFNEPSKESILEAINRVRGRSVDCHDGFGLRDAVAPLVWSEQLYRSAYRQSLDLATSDTFSHLGSGTEYDATGRVKGRRSLFYERIEDSGYRGYNIVGENIAGGHYSLEVMMEELLKSPKHCANIMNREFREVGVAIAINPDSQYKIYWTQDFGG